jgi:WD40 repeat protein
MSDDGKIIAAATGAGGMYVFSNPGKMTGGNANYAAMVRVSPDGKRIVGASMAGLYRYSSTGTGYWYKDITMNSQPHVMEMTGTGSMVIYNDAQRLVSVNVASGAGAEQWKTRASSDVTALAMIPSGTKILVGTQNGNVDLFDNKGNLSWSFATNPAGTVGNGVKDVVLSTDGKIAAAGTSGGKIVVLNAAGKELWSNQTRDHIHHIAMSADGSLVIATGDETVYAFSSSAQNLSSVPSLQATASPFQQKNATSVPATIVPQKTAEISRSVTQAITSAPTPYSVIRTSTRSPVSVIIPVMGILGALLLLVKRRW